MYLFDATTQQAVVAKKNGHAPEDECQGVLWKRWQPPSQDQWIIGLSHRLTTEHALSRPEALHERCVESAAKAEQNGFSKADVPPDAIEV